MKILVTSKRIPDPEENLTIANGALDVSSVKWVPNEFDAYAVETALRIADNVSDKKNRLAEVIVASVCPKDQRQHITHFLAMGADRGIVVDADDSELDTQTVSKLIAEVAKREGVDLVISGKLSQDNEGTQVPQRVAALLNQPQATFAAEVDIDLDAKTLTVAREVDDGVEKKRVPLPAVLSVDLRIVLPTHVRNGVNPADNAFSEGARLASLRGITMAKRKKVEVLSPGDLGVTPTQDEVGVGLSKPPARKSGQMVQSVAELVEKLQSEAKVL